MSTQPQIDANRRNSQKSTGPTSPAGKTASSMNALKTGIHAKALVLPTEDQSELDRLTAEYYQHYQPASPKARVYLDEIVRCEWTLRRLSVAETELWQYSHQEAYRQEDEFPLGQACIRDGRAFNQLQWRIDATRRALHRGFQALEQLQAPAPDPGPPSLAPPCPSPPPQITSPPIGFVPATPVAAPHQPAQALPSPGLPDRSPDREGGVQTVGDLPRQIFRHQQQHELKPVVRRVHAGRRLSGTGLLPHPTERRARQPNQQHVAP
jgi:hypothetical protein